MGVLAKSWPRNKQASVDIHKYNYDSILQKLLEVKRHFDVYYFSATLFVIDDFALSK